MSFLAETEETFMTGKKHKPVISIPANSALTEQQHKLLCMLTYRRPAFVRGAKAAYGTVSEAVGGNTEFDFIETYVLPAHKDFRADLYGNYTLVIGDKPETLFSCHTDTVHDYEGKQKVCFSAVDGHAFTQDMDSSCLGADDTTGCWLMLQMIDAAVPGMYVFHRAEEQGGLGSRYIKEHSTARLYGIKRAIAFDRKGYSDVITHQGGRRCCSDAFAEALSLALTGDMPSVYSPCEFGVFTDTANYVTLIPECTNLSVGYFGAHSPSEYQDVYFATSLAQALIKLNWDALPTVRNPHEVPAVPTYGAGSYTGLYGSHYGRGASNSNIVRLDKPQVKKTTKKQQESVWNDYFERLQGAQEVEDGPERAYAPVELLTFVHHNSALAADFIASMGYTFDDLLMFKRSEGS